MSIMGQLSLLKNFPISLAGAADTGANGDPSDPTLLSRVVPQQRGGLLRPGAAGHHRPLAGRLGAQAGAAGEAVGEPMSHHFYSCVCS